jgi:putative acetyltransferase
MLLRREAPADCDVVRAVHEAAFAVGNDSDVVEARLLDELRADGAVVPELSLVAELDGVVVGHVLCSRGDIAGAPALGLGPIGVLPACQRHGVGHALMHGVVAAADALHEPVIALLGDPGFYSRFGFEPATRYGVLAPEPAWGDYFQVRRLAAWTDALIGPFRYAAAFGRL